MYNNFKFCLIKSNTKYTIWITEILIYQNYFSAAHFPLCIQAMSLRNIRVELTNGSLFIKNVIPRPFAQATHLY